jgi:hypothetical protein
MSYTSDFRVRGRRAQPPRSSVFVRVEHLAQRRKMNDYSSPSQLVLVPKATSRSPLTCLVVGRSEKSSLRPTWARAHLAACSRPELRPFSRNISASRAQKEARGWCPPLLALSHRRADSGSQDIQLDYSPHIEPQGIPDHGKYADAAGGPGGWRDTDAARFDVDQRRAADAEMARGRHRSSSQLPGDDAIRQPRSPPLPSRRSQSEAASLRQRRPSRADSPGVGEPVEKGEQLDDADA